LGEDDVAGNVAKALVRSIPFDAKPKNASVSASDGESVATALQQANTDTTVAN